MACWSYFKTIHLVHARKVEFYSNPLDSANHNGNKHAYNRNQLNDVWLESAYHNLLIQAYRLYSVLHNAYKHCSVLQCTQHKHENQLIIMDIISNERRIHFSTMHSYKRKSWTQLISTGNWSQLYIMETCKFESWFQ